LHLPRKLADLSVEALSLGLMGGHNLFGVAVALQGFGFHLEDQLIVVAEVVPDHRRQGDMSVRSWPPAFQAERNSSESIFSRICI
jgi:hypothetical protein